MIVAVVSRKGGSGKSTTAMYAAALLARLGPAVVVDLDPEGSALSWARACPDLPFPVWPASRLEEAVKGRKKTAVVLDTPPNNPSVLGQAAQLADRAVVMCGTSAGELDRLVPTLDALATLGYARPWGVLLTMARGRNLAPTAREVLEERGVPVIGVIPDRVGFARAWGTVPGGAELEAYREALGGWLRG